LEKICIRHNCLIGIVGGGVQLGPLGTAATNRPIMLAPGDYDDGDRWNDCQRKPKYSEKTCPSTALSTTNPTCCPDANPGCRGGKPASNRLNYGTALLGITYVLNLSLRLFKVVFAPIIILQSRASSARCSDRSACRSSCKAFLIVIQLYNDWNMSMQLRETPRY
jgi:hypothetical protein